MTIAGTWQNEYGSRMTLAVEGRSVFGIYESTTGSTGRYFVAGWQSVSEPMADAGQPVALAIAWHSMAEGPPDASWNWVSSLGGQIGILGGDECLILNHLLVASHPFAGLCERGVYSDKLTYRRVAGDMTSDRCRAQRAAESDDALGGAWCTTDGIRLDALVRAEAHGRFGIVSGKLQLASRALDIVGFTDSNAQAAGIGHQSVAIAAVDIGRNVAIALGGWIDHATDMLSVQSLTNHVTRSDSIYLQTTISPLSFNRCGAHDPQA